MSFLLDTNVVSETRRTSPQRTLLAWLQSVEPDALFVSVLTLADLTKGIAKKRRQDAVAADGLAHWLRGIELLFSDRVLPVDGAVAAAWGEMAAEQTLPVIDSLLAATAKVHNLTVVSRNVADFERTGVPTFNPWES